MLLKEIKNEDEVLEHLKGLPRVDPRILWRHDYYDGALSGVCEINNRRHWFEWVGEVPIHDDDEGEFFDERVYAIVEMTEDQLRLEEASHASFCKYVRNPPWWLNILRGIGVDISKFHYKAQRPRPDFSNSTVVAWRLRGLYDPLTKDEIMAHYLRLYRKLGDFEDPDDLQADDIRDHLDVLWRAMSAAHKTACEKQLDAEKKAS